MSEHVNAHTGRRTTDMRARAHTQVFAALVDEHCRLRPLIPLLLLSLGLQAAAKMWEEPSESIGKLDGKQKLN